MKRLSDEELFEFIRYHFNRIPFSPEAQKEREWLIYLVNEVLDNRLPRKQDVETISINIKEGKYVIEKTLDGIVLSFFDGLSGNKTYRLDLSEKDFWTSIDRIFNPLRGG